jgi:hypothetical protein
MESFSKNISHQADHDSESCHREFGANNESRNGISATSGSSIERPLKGPISYPIARKGLHFSV